MYFKKVSVAEEREYTQLHYVNKKIIAKIFVSNLSVFIIIFYHIKLAANSFAMWDLQIIIIITIIIISNQF